MSFSGKKTKKILQDILKNAIEFTVTGSDEASAPGASAIGGRPRMPEGFRWPLYDDGHPLSFLAQFDLKEIAPYDTENRLPHTGSLSFFYDMKSVRWGFDPADGNYARVYYHDVPPEQRIPTEIPEALEPEYRIPPKRLSFRAVPSLPAFEEFDELYPDTSMDFEDYGKIVEKGFGIDTERETDEIFKLLGYADVIQDSMLRECETVSSGIYAGGLVELTDAQAADIARKSHDWVLLCQFGTLSEECMFGDCGCLYFYIRKQDLADRRFHRIHCILQCC